MLNKIYSAILFRLLCIFSIIRIKTNKKTIYLTFDDGPEPEITEYILATLNKYNAKATFFCTGENFQKYPELIKLIISNGHIMGNHTYSHLNGQKENYHDYIQDVIISKQLIKSQLFRPPWGALTLREYFKIRLNNKIIMWSIASGDTKPNNNLELHLAKLIKRTKCGDIVLFHFCLKHSINTKIILPAYLNAMTKLGYKFDSIHS